MRLTGCSSARSERLVWDQEAPSSNLGTPTTSLTLGDRAAAKHHAASSRGALFAVRDWTGNGLITLERTSGPSSRACWAIGLPRSTTRRRRETPRLQPVRRRLAAWHGGARRRRAAPRA